MSREKDITKARVLIVGGLPHAVSTLKTVLSSVGVRDQIIANDGIEAICQLQLDEIDAVFFDETTPQVDGAPFAIAARRATGVINPMIPIFLVCASPRRFDVVTARDVGVSDIVVRPFSVATVKRKLADALVSPRPFIKAGSFFGPDRRAGHRQFYKGGERRSRVARKVRIVLPASEEG